MKQITALYSALFIINLFLALPCYSDRFEYYKYAENDAKLNIVGKIPIAGEAVLKVNGYKFTYDSNNNLTSVEYYKHGKPVIDGMRVSDNFFDKYFNCFRIKIHRSKDQETRIYYDVNGSRTMDILGAYETRIKRDPSSKTILMILYNKFGYQEKDAVSQYLYYTNEDGLIINGNYFNSDGDRLESGSAYETRYKYDGKGNKIEEAYFDKQARLLTAEAAIIKYGYNDQNLIVEESHYGAFGQLFMEPYRPAIERCVRDLNGDIRFVYYFGVDSQPVLLSPKGIAAEEFIYNEYGDEIEERYFGRDGRLIDLENKQGLAIMRWKYDDAGNYIEEAYFDKYGNPVIPKGAEGIAMLKRVYDKHGRAIKESYYGLNGKLKNHKTYGVAVIMTKYNTFGNIIKESYFGSDGKPKGFEGSGIAAYSRLFDRSGNLIKTVKYNVKGEEIKTERF